MGSYDDRYKRIREAYLGNAESKKTQTMEQSALPGTYGSKYEYIRDRYVVNRETYKKAEEEKKATAERESRQQMQEELEQLRKSYTPGGAFGGRTQEDKDTLHRIQYLENQLSRAKSDDYYQTALKRLGELDEETIGYLDQLREGGTPKATVEMQGIADNRSWEEIYAEQYQMDESVKKALLDKGYTEEQIAQYVKDRTRQANRENYEAEVAKSRAEADNGVMGAVTASAKSIPQNLTGGLGYLSLVGQRLHSDEPLDYYTPEMVGQAKAQAARQTVSQKLEENTELSTALTGNVASFLYNTGMSMADSAAIATMTAVGVPPSVGTAFLGGTAATQATVAAKERGVSDERALLTGLAAGTAEAFFEKVSLDKLLSTSPTEGLLHQRVMQGLKNMGIQGTVEGSEELATSLANAITDALINGGQSEYNQKVQNYMAQGKSAEEADRLATKDFALSLGADFLGGFISGGTMSIGADVARNSAYKSAYGENAQELADEALEIDPKNETALYAKKRLEQGKSVSGAVLRSLVSQSQRKIDADSASAAEAAEETGEAMQDTTEVSEGTEAKRTAVSPISHNTEFTEEEARYIVEEGAKEFGNAASSVVNSYMRGQDPQMYMAQAKLVFNYGKTMSEEKGIPYALNSPLLKSMDETQIRSLFNAGRMQAKAIPVTAVKGKGEVVLTGGIDYSLLGEARQKQVNALSSFAKATGYTIELFESTADEEGKYTAELGSFNPSTGVIRIDINAGRDKVDDLTNYAMVRVASHEITHSFKKNAPQQYVALRDYVTGILADKGAFERLVDKKMSDLGLDHETAVDEVVADGCEMMLRDTRFINNLAKENRTLFEKIRDAIRKFVKKIRDAFEGVEITHEEAQLLKDAENLQKLWDEALARSVENVAAAELAEAGIAVNEETESGSLYSVRDVLSDTEQKKVAKMLVKQFGVTEAEAMSWLKAETSMASLILNPKYSMYLDYEGDPNEVAIKQNSDYPQGTVDFSNICKKRREFTQVMNRILRNFPNHVFAATDLAKIRTIMGQEGMTLPCGICYVEDRRQLDTIVAQDFIDSLKAYREGSKTRPSGKPFNPNQLKGLQMTDGDTYVPSIYELVTLEGRNALKAKNPNMEAAWVKYNNARGMQAVRLLTNEAEYKRQILKYRPKTVQSKNDHGGLRIYSFSDAEMFHLIDIVQVITDSSAVGLKIQGYTKVNEYAKAVRNTGLKLNRSLIPAGDLGYHMEGGKVVLDYDPVEGIDIHHRDFFDSTDNPNVGNIVIGINDTQIRAAMVSDFVDMVIPFHTGQSEDVLGEKGIAAWENYKDYQTEKDIATGKTSKHQINIYTEVIQAAEQEGNPIRNKRQFVEKFLAVCKANGLKPRFAQFLNTDAAGNYVYTEGYHKFLVDFKMFAQTAEGEYLPQMVVKPIFDDAYVTGILESYVEEQQTKDAEVAKQMPRVIERITDEIIKPEGVAESGDVMHSKRDYSYAALTSKPDMTVTAVREETQYDRKTVVETALKSAASVGRRTENGNAVIKVRDIGRDVVVTKRSLVHGLDRRLNVQAPVLENVGSVLQNAIRINELTPRRDDVESTYVLVGAARGTKGMYIASFVVNSITDEVTTVDVLYALNAKKESAALLPKFTDESATPTDSVISVANLLDYVNQYFPDILPEDVLKHYGHDARPEGKLGEDALYSFRTGYIPTDRSILASYVPTDSDSDMVKRHIAEYQQNVKELKAMQLKRWQMVHDLEALADNNDSKSRLEKKRLREEIIKADNRIQILFDQLSRKERWAGIKEVLQREKVEIMRKAKAEEREKLKKYRAQRWDTENRRKLRERISYRVKTLDKMLREPTDDKHIPEAMREMVFDFCEVFTYESGVFSGTKLRQMQAVYTFLKKPDSSGSLADLYDEDIEDMMKYLADTMEGKRLSELDMEQLSMVKAIADHFAFMVKNENEIFVHGRKVKLDETAQGVIAAAKGHKRRFENLAQKIEGVESEFKALSYADKFLSSGNLRPVYFFRDKGSDMQGLFQSLLDAQSEYAFRMEAAQQFAEEVEKATGYSEWGNSEKTLTLTNAAKQQVTLNLQQAMSLLATYERELHTGTKHVTGGGFVYASGAVGTEKAKAHPMSAEDMDKVRTWLGEIDPRVLDYMGKMVEYLSTTMADYGNETSMQLHGYKKFGEEYYWPVKSSDSHRKTDPGAAGFDNSRWKHKGFTKAINKKSVNAFVLRGFMEEWSNHVSQMCMYSTIAVPQDAFVRVMNYTTAVDPTGRTVSTSVKAEIEGNYGTKAAEYIDTFLSDINGGLLTDPRAGALNRLVSLFKKNATFASASVALQQYSAVIRAMVYLDPKYFVRNAGWKKTQEAFERAKQYSGVAIIKEIGGFDTATGRSGANWLMERDPAELKDKAKALFQFGEKDTGYRDRLLTALPAKMDKVGWGHIWIAAENEIADTTDLERGSDAFYEAVAKRFEEVIELTQVYDSVLTRSENMRGKDVVAKAATSFMAEPTVTMNMFVTAAQDAIAGKDGAKARLAKTAFVLAMSVIVNNILKALATAGRDKDEDQTIVEKYVEDVVGGIISDVNPLGYVPILRDIKSIWEGYSVEASYAAVFSDVYDAWTKWEKNQTVESGFDVLNAVAALFGIPAKNLKRDIMAVLDTFLKTAPLSESSKRGFWNATREGLGIMPGVDDKMMEAFEADRKGNEKARKKALDEITRLYEDKAKQYRLEGKEDAAKKAKSSLKSTITSVLKPLYQAAKTQTEKNRIKSLALRVYVGGEQLYNGYDFERYWSED